MSFFRMVLALTAASLVGSCANSGATSGEMELRARDVSPVTVQSGSRMKCPSQDFMSFLKSYANPDDDGVRGQYTADPLAYEVPYHTVLKETETTPETHVSMKTGDSRIDYFKYRYFAWADTFDWSDAIGDPVAVLAMKERTRRTPIEITSQQNGDRKVVFGLEYERDVYEFKRENDCWHLAKVINLRD